MIGFANLPAGSFGAVPLCHGTGGLAAHYRFGARTGGDPVMFGILFVPLLITSIALAVSNMAGSLRLGLPWIFFFEKQRRRF